jgi:hypothetical protein
MQTRTYGDLFKLIQSLAGVSSFATTETDDIANLINRRYFEAYQTIQMWPRYLVTSEERNVSSFALSGLSDASYNAAYTKYGKYESTTGVFTDFYVPNNSTAIGSNFQFLRNSSGKWVWGTSAYQKDPVTDIVTLTGFGVGFATQQDDEVYDSPIEVKNWGSLSGISGFLKLTAKQIVTYDEAFEELTSGATRVAKNTIQEFIRIHRNNAFLNNSSLEYDFFIDGDGANILNISSTDTNTAFVTYKKVFTPFTTSSDYTTSTEEVPSEFFHYIAHSAYSDFLRMDGQHDKAQLEQANAEQYLALELERVDVIMNQTTVNKRFSTHVNRQSR